MNQQKIGKGKLIEVIGKDGKVKAFIAYELTSSLSKYKGIMQIPQKSKKEIILYYFVIIWNLISIFLAIIYFVTYFLK